MFILLPTTAGARVVPSHLLLGRGYRPPPPGFTRLPHRAGSKLADYLRMVDEAGYILPDVSHEGLEHPVGFGLEFHEGVPLTESPQSYALPQLV